MGKYSDCDSSWTSKYGDGKYSSSNPYGSSRRDDKYNDPPRRESSLYGKGRSSECSSGSYESSDRNVLAIRLDIRQTPMSFRGGADLELHHRNNATHATVERVQKYGISV